MASEMDDLYGDGGSSPAPESEDREDSETPTSLLPKSLFPGKECKPGDELRVRVVAVHEGELEVEGIGYSKDGEDEAEEMPAREMQPPSAMDEMMA